MDINEQKSLVRSVAQELADLDPRNLLWGEFQHVKLPEARRKLEHLLGRDVSEPALDDAQEALVDLERATNGDLPYEFQCSNSEHNRAELIAIFEGRYLTAVNQILGLC